MAWKKFGEYLLPTIKTFLPYLFSLAALLIFSLYVWKNHHQYQQLLDLSILRILLLISLAIIFGLLNGLINFFFLRGLGIILTYNESFGIAMVNTLANQLPFAGGLIAKGFYLKKRHQLAYVNYLTATLALYVFFVAINGLIGLSSLGILYLFQEANITFLLGIGFAGMALCGILLWFPLEHLSLLGKIGDQIKRLSLGWQVFKQNLNLLIYITTIQIVMTFLFAGRLWVAFHALTQDVTYIQCIIFSSATVLTRLLNFVPGGIGIREGIVGGLASVMGFDLGVSIVAVGLDRLITTPIFIFLGVIYTYTLSRQRMNNRSS